MHRSLSRFTPVLSSQHCVLRKCYFGSKATKKTNKSKKKKEFTPRKRIDIDVFNEEMFPTRKANLKFESELALKDRIRSVRIARKHRYREILTQQFARLMYLVLSETINDAERNHHLKPLIITPRQLGYIPTVLSQDSTLDANLLESSEKNENNNKNDNSLSNLRDPITNDFQLDTPMQVHLTSVGFELCGVTMPTHKLYAVVWYRYNPHCRFPAGPDCMKYVLSHYLSVLRRVIADKVNMKFTPHLVFKYTHSGLPTNGADKQVVSYYENKMRESLEQLRNEWYGVDSLDEVSANVYLPFDSSHNGVDEQILDERMYYALLERMYSNNGSANNHHARPLHLDKYQSRMDKHAYANFGASHGLLRRLEKRNFMNFFTGVPKHNLRHNSFTGGLFLDSVTGRVRRNCVMSELSRMERKILYKQGREFKLIRARERALLIARLIDAMDEDIERARQHALQLHFLKSARGSRLKRMRLARKGAGIVGGMLSESERNRVKYRLVRGRKAVPNVTEEIMQQLTDRAEGGSAKSTLRFDPVNDIEKDYSEYSDDPSLSTMWAADKRAQLLTAEDSLETMNKHVRRVLGKTAGRDSLVIAMEEYAKRNFNPTSLRKIRRLHAEEKQVLLDAVAGHGRMTQPVGKPGAFEKSDEELEYAYAKGEISTTLSEPTITFKPGSDEIEWNPTYLVHSSMGNQSQNDRQMIVGHGSDYDLVGFEMDD